MGSIWCWQLPAGFVEAFPAFIEAGYGAGGGVNYALENSFLRIFSIDIWPPAVQDGRRRFAGCRSVTIVEGDSAETIRRLLRSEEGPFFLWLDAHFPGGDWYGEPLDKYPERTRMPLTHELRIIQESGRRCCILVDDLRYLDDLPWEHGAAEPLGLPQARTLDFLAPFCADHSVQVFLNDKGYALIAPLDAPLPRYVRKE